MFFSRYYEIVVMKLNKTSLVRKPTHSFENLSTYEEAGFNQPYVTAVLEPNYFKTCDIRNFTIGMSTSFNSLIEHLFLNEGRGFQIHNSNAF